METLEKVWRDGAWWARTPGGGWLRWSDVESAWRPSSAPPDEPSPFEPGWTPPSPASSLAPWGDDGAPSNAVDRWWNRTFPPFSNRRLLFGLAVLPLVGIVYFLYRLVVHDEPFEWPMYLFTTVAAQVFLAVVWLSGSLRKLADARANASPHAPAPPSPLRDAGAVSFPDAAQGGVPLAAPSSRFADGARDFLSGVLVTFAGVELMWLIGGLGEPLSATRIGMSAVVAVVAAFVVHFRHTIAALVVVSVLLGAVGALALEVLSFMLWSDSDFGNAWLWSSVFAFVCGLPLWWHARRTRALLPNVKTWTILAFGSALMVLAGVFARFTDAGAGEAATSRPLPAVSPYSAPTTPVARIGSVSRDAASRMLFDAWRTRSRTTAERVATTGAVDALFHVPVDPAARYLGCGAVEGGWIRCAIEAHGDLLLLAPEHDGVSLFYVDFVERAPADTAITYGDY